MFQCINVNNIYKEGSNVDVSVYGWKYIKDGFKETASFQFSESLSIVVQRSLCDE